ncbi:MAG: response regulator [Hydrocarboniphaga sp.]|uniref:response regulator n=1 Tax=Hydrocarboniphaga sp. TaxID=2033016 RepID=UPI0026336449|nr:response regulator [Hydrocarboniphaga sp.]MDB5969008.1 response regulator [Hydrocarboniphaga sp.]
MSNNTTGKSPVILLVEDNPADVRLACEVLEEAGVSGSLLIARDGEQALKMACSQDEYAGSPTPDLILLDLNLPRKSGLEVLTQLKQSPELRRIPVLILTTSRAESDVNACYDSHANAFLTKPVDMSQFADLAKLIRDFWFGVVQLPGRTSQG